MPSLTYFRLLREHGGDTFAALEHAARTIDHLASQVSVGMMRAGPKTDRAAKRYVEGYDVDSSEAPHG